MNKEFVIYDNSNFHSGIENYVKTISDFLNIPIKKYNNSRYINNIFIPKIKTDKYKLENNELKIIFSNPISPIELFDNQYIIMPDLYFLTGIYTANDPFYSILTNKFIAHEKIHFLKNH
ncbi:MAG: hypothetical protein ACP5LA_07450, partial [Thermoplasmata archaeon]